MQKMDALEMSRYIVAIAQEGSLVRASRKLRMAESSLSKRVTAVEHELGVKLFERTTRRLELTRAGALFVKESALSLTHVDRAWELARLQAQIELGPYHVGYSPYTHSALLPILNHLRFSMAEDRSSPSAVTLECAQTSQLIEWVLQGRLHAALGTAPIEDQDLWATPIGQEGFSVCMSARHGLARKPYVTVRDLDGQNVFWMPKSRQPRFYDHVVSYIRSFGVTPIFREAASIQHILECAAQGLGIGIVPRGTARISYSGAVSKPLTDKYLRIETMLFMRRDQRREKLEKFADALYGQLMSLKIAVN